jgi:hypothetical protein
VRQISPGAGGELIHTVIVAVAGTAVQQRVRIGLQSMKLDPLQ